MDEINISKVTNFEWDEANQHKNWKKHKVFFKECEEIFFNKPFVVERDSRHSEIENRYRCLGRTDKDRLLFISFTLRKNSIRVISARPQSKKERSKYEKY